MGVSKLSDFFIKSPITRKTKLGSIGIVDGSLHWEQLVANFQAKTLTISSNGPSDPHDMLLDRLVEMVNSLDVNHDLVFVYDSKSGRPIEKWATCQHRKVQRQHSLRVSVPINLQTLQYKFSSRRLISTTPDNQLGLLYFLDNDQPYNLRLVNCAKQIIPEENVRNIWMYHAPLDADSEILNIVETQFKDAYVVSNDSDFLSFWPTGNVRIVGWDVQSFSYVVKNSQFNVLNPTIIELMGQPQRDILAAHSSTTTNCIYGLYIKFVSILLVSDNVQYTMYKQPTAIRVFVDYLINSPQPLSSIVDSDVCALISAYFLARLAENNILSVLFKNIIFTYTIKMTTTREGKFFATKHTTCIHHQKSHPPYEPSLRRLLDALRSMQKIYTQPLVHVIAPVFLKLESSSQPEMFTLEFDQLLFSELKPEGQAECIDVLFSLVPYYLAQIVEARITTKYVMPAELKLALGRYKSEISPAEYIKN